MSTDRARELRKKLTPQEARLWPQLRTLRSQGVHFRRQAPFRGYYLDFVSFNHCLVIEVDGGQHGQPDHQHRDLIRDAVLEREGFRVLRFWNYQVNLHFDDVMRAIWMAVQERTPTRPPTGATLPTGGRER